MYNITHIQINRERKRERAREREREREKERNIIYYHNSLWILF